MKDLNRGWNKYDQSIIMYSVWSGKVGGGSDPGRKVKQVQKTGGHYYPGPIYHGGDFTLELDLSNRSFVMEVDNQKITLDGNIGDFDYSPVVTIHCSAPEITLL